ncbi:MAG: hypothetical protein LUH21_04170 [Clostridiales bacterium]|nr:hypothetical protein [Clostridiales bacterium]
MFPSYISSQTEFYNQIAEDYFSSLAATHTKSEYDVAMNRICRKWMREFTDENVLAYYMESGEMDSDDIETIRKYYVDHAEPFQKAVLSANLKCDRKYTLVYLSEFGFPEAEKITFWGVTPCQYAQYTDAVKVRCRRSRKHSDTVLYFYDCSLAVYEGWCDLDKMATYEKVSESEDATMWKSKYTCFDVGNFEAAIKYMGTPIFEYHNYKTRETDGKVFA